MNTTKQLIEQLEKLTNKKVALKENTAKKDLKFLRDWNNGGLENILKYNSINDFENAKKYFVDDIEALKMLEVIIKNFDDVKAKTQAMNSAWSLLFDKTRGFE